MDELIRPGQNNELPALVLDELSMLPVVIFLNPETGLAILVLARSTAIPAGMPIP